MTVMRKRIACITIGQSPRADMTEDLRYLLSNNIDLIEYGALDQLTLSQVHTNLMPKPGNELLVTRMRDGTVVKLDGSQVPQLVQNCITRAEAEDVDGVAVLCTGTFHELSCHVPLLIPQPLFHAVVRQLARSKLVGVLTPDPLQVEQVKQWWHDSGVDVEVVSASPYEDMGAVCSAAPELRSRDVSLICLDCMGYSLQMKRMVAQLTGKPVILPRSLVARIVNELFGI